MARFYSSTTFKALASCFIALLLPQLMQGQITVTMVVTDYEADIANNCDAFGGDSDPRWCFDGDMNGNFETINNCNGCYPSNPPNITIYNETFSCLEDVPNTLTIDFEGCEDDAIGCESRANTTLVVNVPAPGNSANFNDVASNGGGGCPGTYRYWGTITVSGSQNPNPGSNDDACNALPITVNGANRFGNNVCAGTQGGEPIAGGGIIPQRTKWYSFVAPNQAEVEVSTDHGGTNFDTELAVYSGSSSCAFGSFALVNNGRNDDIGLFNNASRVETECLTPGETYYIQVDGHDGGDRGNYELSVDASGPVTTSNDNLCDAITINPNGSVVTGNNYCAGTQPFEVNSSNGGISPSRTIWYRFQAPATQQVTISTDHSATDIDTEIAIYELTGACAFGNLTEVGNNDDRPFPCIAGCGEAEVTLDCLTPGNWYYIQVDGDGGGDRGDIGVSVTPGGGAFSTNDDICNAVNLPTNGSVITGNNTCATVQGGEVDAADGGISPSNTLWYTFTMPADDEVTISTNHGATDIDTEITIYRATAGCSFGGLVEVGSNDDRGLPCVAGCGEAEVTLECLEPGLYYIQLDGDGGGDRGDFGISVSTSGDPQATNDDICDAIDIGLLNLGGTLAPTPTRTFNNFCAGTQSPEPNASWGEDQTVWATFTTGAAVGSETDIDVSNDPANFGDDLHVQVALYESNGGCNTSDLTLIDSQGGASLGSTNMSVNCLEPNTLYYVQIDGTSLNTQGYYGIEVRDNGAPQAPNDNICDFVDLGTLPHVPGSIQSITPPIPNNQKNLLCASVEPGEPTPPGFPVGFNLDATVWFSFTTPATLGWETEVLADSDPYNLGENPDLQLALYTSSDGTCAGTMTEVARDYDPVIFSEDLTIECLEPNTRYFVQVDPGGIIGIGDEGFFELTVTDDGVTRAPNDLICNATPLGTIPAGGDASLNNQNNYCAGISVGEPDPAEWDPDQTVWYSFTPPPSGNVEIFALNTGPDFIDLEAAVWESSDNTCTGTLQQIDAVAPGLVAPINPSIDDREFVVKCLDPTRTYFLQIDGTPLGVTPASVEEEEEGTFDIRIEDYAPSATNDSICDAIPFSPVTNTSSETLIDQNNFCADNIFDPVPSDWGPLQTVWYSFVAPPSGHVFIDADSDVRNYGEDIWLKLAVYSTDDNTCTGSFTEIVSEFNDPITEIGFDEEMDVPCLEPGRRYWIMVDGADVVTSGLDEVDGWFDITLEGVPGTPLANDNICDAIALGDPTGTPINSGEYHNFCATEEPGEPDPHILNEMQTTWFTFTAPASGNVLIEADSDPNNNGDDLSIGLGIFQSSDGTCTGTLNEVDAEFTLPFITFGEDIYVDCLTPGETYYLQVDGAERDPLDILTLHEGFFDLTLTEEPGYGALPNDDLCDATDLGTVPSAGNIFEADGTNFCATQEVGEPDVSSSVSIFGEGFDETVWYRFRTTGSPGEIEVELSDITDDLAPQMNIYIAPNGVTCDFTQLQQIYANNNIIPGFGISETIECPRPETWYYIQIDGADLPDISTMVNLGDDGTFDITITDNGVPPSTAPNDDICDADPLGTLASGGALATSGDNFCSTEEIGEPNVSGSGLYDNINYDETVWFSFETSATPGDVDIEITNTSGSMIASFVLYEATNAPSCAFSDLQEIDQSVLMGLTDARQTFDCLRPNTTYYIQMDAEDALSILDNQGTFDLDIVDNGVPNTFPVNDEYCNATSLGTIPEGGNSTLTSQNNFCATEDPGEPNVSGGSVPTAVNYDETVWYLFRTPANPGLTNINVNSLAGIDASVTVYEAGEACNFGQLIEISSQNQVTSADVDLDLPCLPPLTWYAIQVDGDDLLGNEGTFDIAVSDDGSANVYPNNDDICNAVDFGVLASGGATPVSSGNNRCATEELGEPNVSGSTIITSANYDETLWYEFTTSGTPGTITVQAFNTVGIDVNMTAYIANSGTCAFGNLTEERSTLGALSGDATLTLECLNPNTTYYIQVDGDDVLGNRGTFDLQITDDGTPTPDPSNDEICFANNLGSFAGGSVGPVAGSNACADVEPAEPNVSGNDETVWYSFIAPPSGQATIDIDAIQFIWPTFRIYQSTAPGCNFADLQELSGPHIGINPLDPDVSHTESCLIPGERYYIQLDGLDVVGDDGDFTITISDADPTYSGGPSNNECGSAIPLPLESEPCQGSGAWQTENYGTNPTVSENTPFTQSCGENCGDIWYQFTLPPSGTALIEGDDEVGSIFNQSTMVVAAYTGDCSNLQPEGCNDGGLNDDVSFYVNGTPGETVYLQVWDDGGNNLAEDFNICASFRCGPDDCDVAQLMDFGVPYCFDNDGATGEDSGSDLGYRECGQGGDPDQSVYYTFRTPFGVDAVCGQFTVTVNANVGGSCILDVPTDYLALSIYQDATPCDFNPDLQVECEIVSNCELNGTWNWSTTYTNLEPNMNYTIMLDASTLGVGNHDGFIQVDNTCPLAIDGLNFQGETVENSINRLYWNYQTQAMPDVVNWTIQRGENSDVFTKIGEVNGDLENKNANFEFFDNEPVTGINYYRLMAHKLDGTVEVSDPIALNMMPPKNVTIMNVYPNPTSTEVNLDLSIPEMGTYDIEIYDLVGKRVLHEQANLQAGDQSLFFDVSELSASVYVIECKSRQGAFVDQAKFIKQ